MSVENCTLFGIVEERNAPRERLLSSKVAYLHDWWHGLAGGAVPSWDRFDVIDHARIVANLFLVFRDGDDFRFRVHGEEAIRIFGWNPQGYVIRAESEKPFDRYLHDYYNRVLESREGWRCHGSLLFTGKECRRFESLDVPFRREGAEPDTVLGVVDLV